MNEIMTISGVDCYEKDGTAYLKLETVARGLGFTRTAASGNEVIRWERVEGYLKELGVPTCGHDGFIPENIFYRLAMKAKNAVAEAFQAKVADEIIPSIRKTGSYISPAIQQKQALQAKRLQIMELNAKCRQMKQMTNLWNKAGVEPQYQALALNGYFDGLALPREALKPVAPAMLDATTIADHLGVLSKKGNPHGQAIGAIISQLDLLPEESALTPYSRNGHDGQAIQYTESVEGKVAHWLEEHNYPTSIQRGDKSLTVRYRSAEGRLTN